MMLIPCPACGARPEGEFVCLGEALPPRPEPDAHSDREWAAHIVDRANARGWHDERWWHFRACGLIFAVRRNTVTHAIEAIAGGTP